MTTHQRLLGTLFIILLFAENDLSLISIPLLKCVKFFIFIKKVISKALQK